MLKIRANLMSLARYYFEIDKKRICSQVKFHSFGPVLPKEYAASNESSEALRHWKLSEQDVWTDEDERQLKRYYKYKQKSGDMERAIDWEKPAFVMAPVSVNRWRAKLHGLEV